MRKAGLLIPVASLPSRFGIGDFGPRSYELVDLIKECGFTSQHWIMANGVITTHGGPAAFGLAGFSKE